MDDDANKTQTWRVEGSTCLTEYTQELRKMPDMAHFVFDVTTNVGDKKIVKFVGNFGGMNVKSIKGKTLDKFVIFVGDFSIEFVRISDNGQDQEQGLPNYAMQINRSKCEVSSVCISVTESHKI